MFIIHIWRFVQGYLEIRITGTMVEKFVNLATGDGIFPWDMRRISGGVKAKINITDFRFLRPLVWKTGCRVRILGRYGLPFIIHRLKKRQMLVAGAVLFLLALYLLSSYIWFVDVIGTEILDQRQILTLAGEMGIRPGVLRCLVDVPMVEDEFLIRFSEIAWIGISIHGTRATIEIIERKLPPPESLSAREPCDIVAASDGIITRLAVIEGTALVREGETVTAGTVLISGRLPDYLSNGNLVHAAGIVEARVWREAVGEAPLVRHYQLRTGQVVTQTLVLQNGQRIFSYGSHEIPFPTYEMEQISKKLPQWRNLLIPVEIILVQYHETEQKEEVFTPDKAIDLARQKAAEALQARLPDRAVITSQQVEVLSPGTAAVARVRLVVESNELIGIPRRIGGTP